MKIELRRIDSFPAFNPDKFSAYPYNYFTEWTKPSQKTIKKVLKMAESINGMCIAIIYYRKKPYVLGESFKGFPRVVFFNATYQSNLNSSIHIYVDNPFGYVPIFDAWLYYEPGQYV